MANIEKGFSVSDRWHFKKSFNLKFNKITSIEICLEHTYLHPTFLPNILRIKSLSILIKNSYAPSEILKLITETNHGIKHDIVTRKLDAVSSICFCIPRNQTLNRVGKKN